MENEKMKLYKVTFSRFGTNLGKTKEICKLFIISINEKKAEKKAIDFIDHDNYNYIYCEFICNRDEIIPTVEPIQEFKNL